ncbi:MAG: hypothetical protein DME26_19355 [Verrucomicrobia bacterium]|nr:MAG: hypothetical protein DME26_19355 [Verrucomicrobiota bacterium]
MKKSRQVALLITGSVVLAACNKTDDSASPGASASWSTNVDGTIVTNQNRSVSRRYYSWYHPYRYFGPGSSSFGSSATRSSGSTSRSSSTSRGGFGSHGSSIS